jgi:hypothetical protein
MLRVSLAAFALLAALPATAQDRGGMQMNQDKGGMRMNHERGGGGMRMNNSHADLDRIQANQGCPMSATSVTVGVNKTTGLGSSAQQQLGTNNGGSSGCRPLVSTQVVTGANLALGRGSNAGQSITAQGPSGVLATKTYTRGYNMSYGPLSSANQRLFNQTGR